MIQVPQKFIKLTQNQVEDGYTVRNGDDTSFTRHEFHVYPQSEEDADAGTYTALNPEWEAWMRNR